MSRGALIGLFLVAASAMTVLGGGSFLARTGKEAILHVQAETTADQWVHYIRHVVPELSEIASGETPSNDALMFLAHGIDTSSVINYRFYDKEGKLRLAGGADAHDAVALRRSWPGVLTVLDTGQNLLRLDVHRSDPGERPRPPPMPASEPEHRDDHHHHDTANHAGTHHGHQHDMSEAPYLNPAIPIMSGQFITAFFHPIFVGERLAGVLQIELDHSAIATSFESTFRTLSTGLTLILALAIAPPFVFGWHKSIQRARAERKARHLAYHDPLTHIPNRRYAHEEIEKRLKDKEDVDGIMALLCLDLDGFKSVNDAFGHAAGDDLLRQAVTRLAALLGPDDMLARLGGDEFLVLPKLGTSSETVQRLADAIIDSFCRPFAINGQYTTCGASIGVVLADQSWTDRDQLLHAGDVALYEAKAQGRRCAVLFDPSMEERLRKRRDMERDLRFAVARDELILHYQPQFQVKTRALTGFEALVRWQHPTLGLLPPTEFIEVAEHLRMIDTISRWVMQQACEAAMTWSRPLKVAVNVSAIEFEEGNLVATIKNALSESGLPAERLEIEITESVIMTNTEAAIKTLKEVRALGVSVAMDDFGTGYSSLGYLCKFPFDKLKIDRSFLLANDQPRQSMRIIETIISLGQSLDLNIVAEGVEHGEQLTMLEALSCGEAQGFHLGRPMAAEETSAFVDEHRAGPDERVLADTSQAAHGHPVSV